MTLKFLHELKVCLNTIGNLVSQVNTVGNPFYLQQVLCCFSFILPRVHQKFPTVEF